MQTRYAKEIWKLFEEGELQPETQLTGTVAENTLAADVDGVLAVIEAAEEEERERQERKAEASSDSQ